MEGSSFGESNPTLLKARQNSYGFSDDSDNHVMDVLKLTSSVQLQKYGVLNNTFDPKTYDEVKPRVLLEILSSKSATVLMSLIYVVFICCFIADCDSVYKFSQIVTQKRINNPTVVNVEPSNNLVYFWNETIPFKLLGVNNVISMTLNVAQNNISLIRNWTSPTFASQSACPTISTGYEVNIWACYSSDGCGPLPSVQILSNGAQYSTRFGNVNDDLFESGSKGNTWQAYSSSFEYFRTNYCVLETEQTLSVQLFQQDQGTPQLPSRTTINFFGISVGLFDNPYGILLPLNQDVADSITYSFKVNNRPLQTGGLYVFGHLLLLLCLFLCIIGVIGFLWALLRAEGDSSKWVPEQRWAVFYIVFIIFYLNPLDVYGELFVTQGWESVTYVDPSVLSFISFIIYIVGQAGFQLIWLIFADSLAYRSESPATFLTPKITLLVSFLFLLVLVLTIAYLEQQVLLGISPRVATTVFAIASLLSILVEFVWVVYWVFLMVRTLGRLSKLPYMRTRQMQLSFNYFNRCAILYFPYMVLQYVLAISTVVVDRKKGITQGAFNTDDVSFVNDIDFNFSVESNLVGKAIFLTTLAFTITFLHLPAKLFADPDHNRISSQIIAVPLLTEDEKTDAAQSIVASYAKLNKYQIALLEGVAGRNKPFKFSIDLSSILITLSTDIYIDKKSNDFVANRRKSRASYNSIGLSKIIDSTKDTPEDETKTEKSSTSAPPSLRVPASPEDAYEIPSCFEGDNAQFQFLKLFVDEATQTVCVVGRRKRARRLVIAFRGSCGETNIHAFDDKIATEVEILSLSPEASFPPRMLVAASAKLLATGAQQTALDTASPRPVSTGFTLDGIMSPKTPEPASHAIQVGPDLYADTWKENVATEESLLQIPRVHRGMSQSDINRKSIEMRMTKLASAYKEDPAEPTVVNRRQSSTRLRRQSSVDYDEVEQRDPGTTTAATGPGQQLANSTEAAKNCVETECKRSCMCIGQTCAHICSTGAGVIAYGLASVERAVTDEISKYPRFAPKIKLHSGFWNMYKSIRNQLHEFVRTELVLEPADVLVTGHCLGGALATLCALDLSVHTVAPINLFLNADVSKPVLKRRRK